MVLRRRTLLSATLAAAIPTAAGLHAADAAIPDGVTPDTLPSHAFGDPNAKIVVQEWFSLTCTHCAHFSRTVFPEIKGKLIDTGRIRYVLQDFPLDRLALAAAMIADALPAERYLPFVDTLLSSQDRWAFDRSADPIAMLRRDALLAGMPAADTDAVLGNTALQRAIIGKQDRAQKQYAINGTPTFVFNQTVRPTVPDYDAFARFVADAGG